MAGVKETILEQTDESSREAGVTDANPEKLDYDPLFRVSKFDIEMWTRKKKASLKPFYFSGASTDCLFQFCYYSNTGLLLQDSADRAFLTGWWKPIDLQTILLGVKPTNPARFASLPSTEVDSLVLAPEKMYPDTENFLDLDFSELEAYIEASPESCIGPLARVLIARKNKDPSWGRLAKMYHKCCPQAAAVWMRVLAANIQNTNSEQLRTAWAAEIIQVLTYSLLHSGLYYFTKEDRTEVSSVLGFVFGVILDTVPSVRTLGLEIVRGVIALFNKDSYDLFEIEAAVWRDDNFLDKILLYMFMETDRTCPVYQKAKYFMEHFVLSQSRKGKYGLVVADFYELDSAFSEINDQGYQQKIIEFYTHAYKSSNEFVSMSSLSRLAIIYQRRWKKMMANPSPDLSNQILTEEYNSLLDVHKVLAKVERFESMEFMLNHYYLCHSFSVGELENLRRPQRDIDNLIGNRRVSLEMCKPYFNYFYVIGQKAPYLEDYFRVLHYLGYIEAGLVALRYGTLMQNDECTLAKRVYYYALCKAEGLGIDFDPVYAGQVFYRIFLDEAEKLSESNLLEVVVQLYHLVQLTPEVENEAATIKSVLFGKMPEPISKKNASKPTKSKSDIRLELAEELINLVSQVKEFTSGSPSKKYLYYSVQVLKTWKSLRKPQGNSDLNFERLLVQLIQKSFFTNYQSAEDYYYQYLLEAEISQSLCNFQSISQVLEDKSYSSHLEGFRCTTIEEHKAALAEVVELLTSLFQILRKQKDAEVSRYHLLENVKQKADGVLRTIIGEGQANQQSPTQRRSSKKGSIVRPAFELSATQSAPARRVGSKKKLSLVSKKEMELKLGTHQTIAMMSSLDVIGRQMSVLSLMSEFKARFVKEGGGLRLFSEGELEEVYSEEIRPLHGVVPVRKMRFKRNNQLCRVFELEFSSSQDCDEFYEQIQFATTWSVYFLNYYGVFLYETLNSSTSFRLGLVAEPFDRLALASSNSSSVWTESEYSLQDKCIMFLDLIAAIRQLQTARIPHLMLSPSFCAIYRSADKVPHLKVIMPFFLSVWSSPEEHLQRPSPLEDLVYLPPHIYVLKTYPASRQLPLITDPSDTKSTTILNADAWSLAVTFLTMTQSCRFLSVIDELDTSEQYLALLSRKNTLAIALEDQLSWWKKNFKQRRVPFHELQRMLSLKPQQRLGLTKSLDFLEMFVTKELLENGPRALNPSDGQEADPQQQQDPNAHTLHNNSEPKPPGLFGSNAFSPLTSALLRLAKTVHPSWAPSGKDGFAGVDMPAWEKDLRAEAESGEVILPLGLEYIGGLKFNEGRLKVMPHGTGTIRRGRRVILEGEFLSGTPSGKLILHGENAAKLELDVDEEKGVVKECCASWSDEKFLKEDILDILTPIVRPGSEQPRLNDMESATRMMMLMNLDHLRSLFQDNEKRKILQADLKNHLELDKIQQAELNNDLMSNLARMVLGEALQVITAEQNPKPALVKEQGGGLFDNFFKNEEWQDDEESQNDTGRPTGAQGPPKSKLATFSKANMNKFGRPDIPLSQQSYDAQLQLLTNYIDKLRQGAQMFCPPGYTIAENQRSPGKRKSKGHLNLKNMFNIVGSVLASPFAQEKEKKLVRAWDPFGYEYIMWQDELGDSPDVSLGLLRRPVGYENYLSTVVFLPSVSNYIFFETDIFRHRLVDTLTPVTTLHKLTNAAKKSGFVVETDLTGEQRAVKMIEGRVASGTAISVRTNRSIVYKEERTTDVAFGSLYLKDDDFIYQGEIQSGMMCGEGKLRPAKNGGTNFYQGEFRDDLPHGTGIFTESTGEIFTGSFYHGVRVIGILNGNKSSIREGLFIPKKQVEGGLSPLRQAVRINQGSAIVVGRMTIPEKLVCFGVLQENIAQLTGFFKVKYPSGDQYQGFFNCGRRFGQFVHTAPEGDILIGKWLLEEEEDLSSDKYSLQGLVIWNESSSRQFSKGIFKLNSRGEIEQGQYGIIKNRDGSIYTGEIYNNKYEGTGKLKKSDKSFYEGYFRDGMYHGWGECYTASTRTTFKGQFDHGVIQGFGILISEKAVIKGYFVDGICQIAYREDFQMKLDGKEVRSLVARTVQNQDGAADGYDMDGVCRAILADGEFVFEGEIRMGKIEGRGVLYRAEELVFEGMFKNGFYHIGRLVIHPKVIFSGEFDRSNPTCPGIKKDRDLVIEGTFQHTMNAEGKLDPIMNSICLVYNKLLKELKVGYFKDGRERDCFLVKKEMGRANENSNSAGNQRGMNMAGRRNLDGGGIYARNKGPLMPISSPLFRLEFYDQGVLESSKDFPAHYNFSI